MAKTCIAAKIYRINQPRKVLLMENTSGMSYVTLSEGPRNKEVPEHLFVAAYLYICAFSLILHIPCQLNVYM